MIVPTSRGDYPTLLPPLRPLTAGQAQHAIGEHLAGLLRALGELSDRDRINWATVLGDYSGTPEAFVPVHRAASLLAMIVHAHPDAAAAVADHLEPS